MDRSIEVKELQSSNIQEIVEQFGISAGRETDERAGSWVKSWLRYLASERSARDRSTETNELQYDSMFDMLTHRDMSADPIEKAVILLNP